MNGPIRFSNGAVILGQAPLFPLFRYRYIDKAYRASGAPYTLYCDPVRRDDGKCIVGNGTQLVRFADGTVATVVRRNLRLCDKGATLAARSVTDNPRKEQNVLFG